MAGLAHFGVGFAAKKFLPKINIGYLLLGAWIIDIVWGFFFLLGIEHFPKEGEVSIAYWSHGLFMSLAWSGLAGFVTWLITKNRRMSIIFGLLVFSHWIVDFISHPMTAIFSGDTGLPLFFSDKPLIGLGVWSTKTGAYVGEWGFFVVGIAIYIMTLIKLKKSRK